MITVTFDSNVWENIVDEDKRKDNSVFEKLYKAITTNQIRPYFFEGALTYESIMRNDRQKYFGSIKPNISVEIDEASFNETNMIHLKLCISPSSNATITPSNYLECIAPKAFELGFKCLKAPRIGGLSSDLAKNNYADDEFYKQSERLERYHECSRYIQSLGCGKDIIDKLVAKCENQSLPDAVKSSSDIVSNKKISSSISEWSDGDALAAHYGYGIKYFCTYDNARNAGKSSIFSKENRSSLEQKYKISIKTPEKIIEILNNEK